MKTLILITLLTAVGCSSPLDEAKTCSESMGDWYSAGCALTSGGSELTVNEATINCRKIVNGILNDCSKCEDELADWLNCQPTITYGCKNCDKYIDKMLNCCAKNK